MLQLETEINPNSSAWKTTRFEDEAGLAIRALQIRHTAYPQIDQGIPPARKGNQSKSGCRRLAFGRRLRSCEGSRTHQSCLIDANHRAWNCLREREPDRSTWPRSTSATSAKRS